MIIRGIIAVIIGYLLGSLPTAYLTTRFVVGKDIRQLGGGNIGGLNVYREVGIRAGVIVAIVDITKGTVAVAIALWILGRTPESQPWILVAALAAVIGHNWMVWLRFTGGKGMGTAVGTMLILFPLYYYWPGLLIFFGIVLVPMFITRNVALSMLIGLLALPFIAWLGVKSGWFITWSITMGLIIGLKFLPTAMSAWAKMETKTDFIFGDRKPGKKL